MAAQGVEEARLAEFVARGAEGLGDAVGVEGEDVSGGDLALADFAIPLFEDAEDGGGGSEACHAAVVAEKKCWEMAAVGVAEQAGGGIRFGGEKGGERGRGGGLC